MLPRMRTPIRLAALLLAACGGAPAVPPLDTMPAAADPAEAMRPRSPGALLEAIRDRISADDLEGIRALVLDYEGPRGEPVADEVIRGIADGRVTGDFSYSAEALDAAIARANEFTAPDAQLSAQLMRTFGTLDPRLADPTRYRIFDGGNGGTHILLVEVDGGEYRLVFWESLTSLVSPEPAASTEEDG